MNAATLARRCELEAAIKRAPPLPEKPGGPDNWVEAAGGLPDYIDRIARHLFHGNKARFPTVGKAVAAAVSRVKVWCASSDNPAVKAKACNAVRQWMQKRARSHVTKAAYAAIPEWANHIARKDRAALDRMDIAMLALMFGEDIEASVVSVSDADVPEEIGLAAAMASEARAEEDTGVRSSETAGADEVPGEETSPALAGPFVKKNAAKQIAYAPVLIPGEKDSDGEEVTREKIEEVAHDFLLNHRYMDEQHRLGPAISSPVESYILPTELQVNIAGTEEKLPAGTWIMGAKFPDPDVWSRVASGELEGFSITGVRKSDYEAAIEKAAATKSAEDASIELPTFRVKLSDLGEDWVCPAVSVVKGPSVFRAKWFALKSRGEAGGGDDAPADEAVRFSAFSDFLAFLGLKSKPVTQPQVEDGEVLDVEITKKELEQLVEAKAEELITSILSDMEDEEPAEDSEAAPEETAEGNVVFDDQEALNAYINEQVTSAVAGALEEVEDELEDDDEDDSAAAEASGEAAETLAAVKSRLTKLEARSGLVGKSKVLSGNGEEDEVPSTFNIYDYLNRDMMGNKKKPAKA